LPNSTGVLYIVLFAENAFLKFEVALGFLYQTRSHPSEGFTMSSFVRGYIGLLAPRVHRSPPIREEVHISKTKFKSLPLVYSQQDDKQQLYGNPHLLESYKRGGSQI